MKRNKILQNVRNCLLTDTAAYPRRTGFANIECTHKTLRSCTRRIFFRAYVLVVLKLTIPVPANWLITLSLNWLNI